MSTEVDAILAKAEADLAALAEPKPGTEDLQKQYDALVAQRNTLQNQIREIEKQLKPADTMKAQMALQMIKQLRAGRPMRPGLGGPGPVG
jgi:chromosome segregation ATPase